MSHTIGAIIPEHLTTSLPDCEIMNGTDYLSGVDFTDHLIEETYPYRMYEGYEEFKYSHLTKKQREADILPVRNSKKNPKVGRNELCPCGSKKKYKNCCFLKHT